MNSVWACFLIGLVLGLGIAGFITYKIEEDKILTLENKQQAAVINDQKIVIVKQQQGQSITQKVVEDYEKNLLSVNAPVGSVPASANSTSKLRKVSKPTTGVDATCKLRLSALQEWISEEIIAFNK